MPKKGAIVASPVLAAYDPDPDYFFHWFRDSAVVIDALRLLYEDGSVGEQALAQFGDFVRFSLRTASAGWPRAGERIRPGARASPRDFEKFVRADADLACVHGEDDRR